MCARGVGSNTLIFTLGFVFCCLQIFHALKGFFHALKHNWCCTIIFAFAMLMHQVVRWTCHMIGSIQHAFGVGQIDSCNQSQSSIKFRCLILHKYSILDLRCMMPLEFPHLWLSWNVIRLGLSKSYWIKLCWVSMQTKWLKL